MGVNSPKISQLKLTSVLSHTSDVVERGRDKPMSDQLGPPCPTMQVWVLLGPNSMVPNFDQFEDPKPDSLS